jgi:hypothetical protein
MLPLLERLVHCPRDLEVIIEGNPFDAGVLRRAVRCLEFMFPSGKRPVQCLLHFEHLIVSDVLEMPLCFSRDHLAAHYACFDGGGFATGSAFSQLSSGLLQRKPHYSKVKHFNKGENRPIFFPAPIRCLFFWNWLKGITG